MPKTVFLILLTFLFSIIPPGAFSQKNKNIAPVKKTKTEEAAVSDDAEFYLPAALAADLKQAEVVADVSVLSFELVDQIGQGGCAQSTGVGYC